MALPPSPLEQAALPSYQMPAQHDWQGAQDQFQSVLNANQMERPVADPRAELYRSLSDMGFAMAAAGARPGATFGGALGEAGQKMMAGKDARKDKQDALMREYQKSLRETAATIYGLTKDRFASEDAAIKAANDYAHMAIDDDYKNRGLDITRMTAQSEAAYRTATAAENAKHNRATEGEAAARTRIYGEHLNRADSSQNMKNFVIDPVTHERLFIDPTAPGGYRRMPPISPGTPAVPGKPGVVSSFIPESARGALNWMTGGLSGAVDSSTGTPATEPVYPTNDMYGDTAGAQDRKQQAINILTTLYQNEKDPNKKAVYKNRLDALSINPKDDGMASFLQQYANQQPPEAPPE